MTTIVVGDWVVAGKTPEERECGRIDQLDGDDAQIAWHGGGYTDLDLSRDDVEVYATKQGALDRETELDREQNWRPGDSGNEITSRLRDETEA